MRPRPTAVILAAAVVPVAGAGIAAAASTGASAPDYPGSKLAISVSKTQRAGSLVSVTLSGTNALFDPSRPDTSTPYTVNVFVQTRAVLASCPRSYEDQLNNVINLGSRNVYEIGNGYNLGRSGAFRFKVKYRSGAARRVVYCAYTRLITDDAAYAQLRQTLAKPRSRS